MYTIVMENGRFFSQSALHGYIAITQFKSCTSKEVLVIYIGNKYKAERIMHLNISEHCEGIIIKVNIGN